MYGLILRTFVFLILASIFYSVYKIQKYSNLPIWIYAILLVGLLFYLLPKKVVFEYDCDKKVLKEISYGFIFYKQTTMGKEVLKSLKNYKGRDFLPEYPNPKFNYIMSLFGTFNNITVEQFVQISKFLGVIPTWGIPYK